MTITPREQQAIDRWHEEQMEVYRKWKVRQAVRKLHRDSSEEDVDLNPKDIAGSRKPPLDLIPPVAEVEMAMAMKAGADAYGVMNWRQKKITVSRYVAAMKRHITKFAACEDKDDESGVHHLGHVMATAAILLDAFAHDCVNDDRIPSHVADLIREYTENETDFAKPVEDPTEVE